MVNYICILCFLNNSKRDKAISDFEKSLILNNFTLH